MPILSRRSQSQYSRRQPGSGQSFAGAERRKRHNNAAVHPAKSTFDNHNLMTPINAVYRNGTSRPVVEHSRAQVLMHEVHNMTSLPEVNHAANGSAGRTASGSLYPAPPPSPPPLTYYCRPAVARQRRVPADDVAREREALKRRQRLQVVKPAIECNCR